jgi:DNA polymerase-3 subunit epsilon
VSPLDSAARQSYLQAALPQAHAPWREVRFTVVDLELTGLDPASNEIVSFATVTVRGGRVQLEDSRYELVRPLRMPDWDTIRIHGLREPDLEQAPSLDDVIDGLLEALSGTALIAHVAAIETGFLQAAFEPRGLALRNPVVDTAALALELGRLRRDSPPPRPSEIADRLGVSTPALGDVARWLGLPIHRPHHAQGDALTTAQVFIALASHLDRFAPQTLGSLVRVSQPRREPVSLRSLLGRFGSERSQG